MTGQLSRIFSENTFFGHFESMWPLQINSEVYHNFIVAKLDGCVKSRSSKMAAIMWEWRAADALLGSLVVLVSVCCRNV